MTPDTRPRKAVRSAIALAVLLLLAYAGTGFAIAWSDRDGRLLGLPPAWFGLGSGGLPWLALAALALALVLVYAATRLQAPRPPPPTGRRS